MMEAPQPKWDFKQWIPDLVVVCLGLNDHSGLKDKEGNVSEEKSALYRKGYHDSITTLRAVYPGVTILAVAAYPEWIRKNVSQVVNEEQQSGRKDIYYATFDDFPDGYVANGHPTVETHRKISDQLIHAIDTFHLFPEGKREIFNSLKEAIYEKKITMSLYGHLFDQCPRCGEYYPGKSSLHPILWKMGFFRSLSTDTFMAGCVHLCRV